MNPTKQAAIVAGVLGIAAAIFAGFKFSEAARAKATLVGLDTRSQESAARMAKLESQLQAEAKHAQDVEADNALLAEALKQAQLAAVAKTGKALAPLSREAVDARFKRALELAKTGNAADALRELLGCDEDLRRLGGSQMSVRISMLTRALGELGQRNPEALDELRKRRDALRQKVMAGPGGSDAVSEFAAVAKALKEDQSILELYDAAPAGDRRRSTLAIYGSEQLLAAQRYTALAENRSYAMMSGNLEIHLAEGPGSQNSLNSFGIRTTSNDIEILAGAGDLDHARTLMGRLFSYDNSESTKAAVRQHLERAGHPELLTDAPKP